MAVMVKYFTRIFCDDNPGEFVLILSEAGIKIRLNCLH